MRLGYEKYTILPDYRQVHSSHGSDVDLDSLGIGVNDYVYHFQIREIVASIGVRRTEYLLNMRRYRRNPQGAHVASMPQTRCTFLGFDYKHRPGTQNHEDSLRNPVILYPTTTWISELAGKRAINGVSIFS